MTASGEFDSLYVSYRGQITKYCLYKLSSLPMAREIAEECANDVFMILFDKWDEIERGDGIRAWLYRTADNVVRNKLRAEKRRTPDEYIEEVEVPDSVEALAVTDEYFTDEITPERFERHMKERLSPEEYDLFARRFVKRQNVWFCPGNLPMRAMLSGKAQIRSRKRLLRFLRSPSRRLQMLCLMEKHLLSYGRYYLSR